MTTTKTPLRLTFGGGGSDLTLHRGVCLAATINQHVTVTVSPTWQGRYTLHYSHYENVADRRAIQHRIIRRVFDHFDVPPGIQVSSVAEIPAGTGLGSSGAFTVGLLKALHPDASRAQLTEWACNLDIGQQDQWAAVYGGWNIYDFAEGIIRPINTRITHTDFALYYTGLKHDSAQILTGPTKPYERAQGEVALMANALEQDDLRSIGIWFDDQWHAKYAACPSREHRLIDTWIQDGIRHGAYGGKLVGAGNGGFILYAVPPDITLDEPMGLHGLTRIPFAFTDQGVQCV